MEWFYRLVTLQLYPLLHFYARWKNRVNHDPTEIVLVAYAVCSNSIKWTGAHRLQKQVTKSMKKWGRTDMIPNENGTFLNPYVNVWYEMDTSACTIYSNNNETEWNL